MVLGLSGLMPGFLFGRSVFFSYLGMCHPLFISMGVQATTIPVYGHSPPYPVILLCSKELTLIMTHSLTPSGLRRKAPNAHSQHLPVPNGLSTTIW